MLELVNIKKSFKTGDFEQQALRGVSLKFKSNEFVAILGPSGSGKTTLLNIVGGLDRYDSGDLIINGKSTKKFKDKDWDAYRNNCIGFIFQSYNLISHLSILANIELCMTLSGISAKERRKRALEVLEKVGLKEHAHKHPNQLSGGQAQRVAIARALVNDPDIILADEPTGALDSVTSVQIMNLIKEIAKEKLVIMVTHNAELANEYATRIVKLKDGSLLEDSDSNIDENVVNSNYSIRKTSMGFFSALNLSFNNIKTKKGRTLLTAFASSIGIIGIALILALSNGFDKQIDKFEQDTLCQMPIVISSQTISMTEDTMAELQGTDERNLEEYSDEKIVRGLKTALDLIHKNNITTDYTDHIKSVDEKLISGIAYNRATKMNLFVKNDDKVSLLDTTMIMAALPENLSGSTENTIIDEHFECIYGKMPTNETELILLVDSKNRVASPVLEALGYSKDAEVTFDELLSKEFKIVLNNDMYTKVGNYFTINMDFNKLYDNESNITLKLVGIARGKRDDAFGEFSGSGIIYKEALMSAIIENNKNSDVVIKQRDADYNVLTGEKFDLTTDEGKTTKDTLLAYLGEELPPVAIQIYPKDFNTKEDLLKYLDNYNEGKSENEKVVYTDYAETISSLSGGIMDAITWVLVGFSSISLIVSTVMISIITYISVLERTKEIGILRAIGARKKDITRVFNAETFIIGLCSGLLGLLIARLLIIPINNLLLSLTELENVAQMNPVHALVLLIISILLTLLGGWIPAKMAAKKDPVNALRVE